MRHLTTLLSLTLLASIAACGASTGADPNSGDAQARTVPTIDSIDAVRDRFNADADKPRFITILSPT